MKRKSQNIATYLLASIVFFLSIGVNISKITCHENSIISFGNSQLACHEDIIDQCALEVTSESCCSVEEIVECCSSFKDACDKESSILQYCFYTVISEDDRFEKQDLHLINNSFIKFNKLLSSRSSLLYKQPPPLTRKLILSKLQTFLI